LSALATDTSLDDTNVTCGTNYCYQNYIQLHERKQSISLEKCATAFSSKIPVAPQNVSSFVGEDGGVDLNGRKTLRSLQHRITCSSPARSYHFDNERI
jgi:hypothetical protein